MSLPSPRGRANANATMRCMSRLAWLPAPVCLTCQPYLTVSLACLSLSPACLPCLLVSPTLSALACLTVPSCLWLGHVLRQNTRNLSAFSYRIEVCLGSCLYIEDVQLLHCLLYCIASWQCPSHYPSLSLWACLSAPLIWPTDMTVCCILRLIMASSQAGSQAVTVITLALWQL